MIMDKNEVKFEVIAFLVLFATLTLTTVGCASAAETHYVNPGESIQAAIGNAIAGDTIIVRDGTYTENVDVNVNHLTIKSEHGADSTIVQAANTSDNVFAVTADYVNISGFTVKNATKYYKAGIYLGRSADHCNISYNNATRNHFGICLFFSGDNMLVNNTANSNTEDGIHLENSRDNMLVNNTANSNDYGIHLMQSSDNMLVNNTASSNIIVGVHLFASGRNTLTGNTANSNRGNGIYLFATPTKNNTLTNNTANSNHDCGIYFKYLGKNNTLANNTVNSNSNYGICLKSSSDNRIYNNYLNNRNNAYDEGNNTWNITKTLGTNIIGGPYLGGNYWSDYAGDDSDGDGLGNTLLPYNSSGSIENGGDWLPLVKPSAP